MNRVWGMWRLAMHKAFIGIAKPCIKKAVISIL